MAIQTTAQHGERSADVEPNLLEGQRQVVSSELRYFQLRARRRLPLGHDVTQSSYEPTSSQPWEMVENSIHGPLPSRDHVTGTSWDFLTMLVG
jgi:hypothetical protein